MTAVQKKSNKKYGAVFNNDINNILYSLSGWDTTLDDYLEPVYAILDSKPGIFAQNVGMPEAVSYISDVESMFDKHYMEVIKLTWPDDDFAPLERSDNTLKKIMSLGTDPFSLTIKACRDRGIMIVASYRMNAEDAYQNTWMLSDFGREHPELRMRSAPGSSQEFYGCLDPAYPEVYEHRMKIFTDVAENHDVDGIEFDFRRWTHMISEPLRNYPILTQMVRETRGMLDRVSKKKGKDRMILGVRVGPSISDIGRRYEGTTTGAEVNDISCKELGLDVETWVKENIVDYICPSLFWPRWPGLPDTSQFVNITEKKNIGVYPTLFPLPSWLSEEGSYKGPIEFNDKDKLNRYKNEFCDLALKLYADGADGISTFNWYFHLRKAKVSNLWTEYYGYGPAGEDVQSKMLLILNDPEKLKEFRKREL